MSTPAQSYRIASLIEEGLTPSEILSKLSTKGDERKHIDYIVTQAESLRADGLTPTQAILLYYVIAQAEKGIKLDEGQLALELGVTDVAQLTDRLERLQQRGENCETPRVIRALPITICPVTEIAIAHWLDLQPALAANRWNPRVGLLAGQTAGYGPGSGLDGCAAVRCSGCHLSW